MKAFICVLVACFIAAQAKPTFDLLGGANPLSSVGGIVSSVTAGINPSVVAGAFLNIFGGSSGVVPTGFLSAFKSGLSKRSDDGSIPLSDFEKCFNSAGGSNALPTGAFDDIFKSIPGLNGAGNSDQGLSSLLAQCFGNGNSIPPEFADEFGDILNSEDDVPASVFASTFQHALEKSKVSGSSNTKDSVTVNHEQSNNYSAENNAEKSSGQNFLF